MPEGNKPFVVTDRRKFTMEGEVRPEAERSAPPEERAAPAAVPAAEAPEALPGPAVPAKTGAGDPEFDEAELGGDEAELPAPTADQIEQSKRAYEATAERLETAIRATNPGMEHPPEMNFEQLVQSLYLTAIMQLGGGTAEGEQPRVDLLGARSSIDMLALLPDKTRGNLSSREEKFLESALFELRMAFLEMTQALARSAQSRGGQAGQTGPGGGFGGSGTPTLVR